MLFVRCLLLSSLLFLPSIAETVEASPPRRIGPRALVGLSAPTKGATVTERALDWLQRRPDLALDTAILMPVRVTRFGAERVIHFEQVVRGLRVEERSVSVQLAADGSVKAFHSDYMPVTVAAERPDIGEAAAREVASARLDGALTGTVEKVILAARPDLSEVAYRVAVARIPLVQHYFVYVAERDGQVLRVKLAGKDMPREVSP